MLIQGSTFGAYEVQRRLAVGGMGEVYLCRHRLLNRLDAVKVLRPHLAADALFRRRFLREALSVARVRHPSVINVYTADETDGLLYLAMEYVDGDDLATLLAREGRLAGDRVVALLTPVADALDAAHQAHLVHRDVKPSNLMVAAPGTPKETVTLLDFGISRMLDDDSEITKTGEIVGTIAYCSPEQLSRRDVDGACDQYSLACVAYECLTGEVPFVREGQLALMTAHLTATPPRVTTTRPDLPAAVDAVIGRGMAKDPAARYPNCRDFVAGLAAALSGGGSRQHPDFPDPAGLSYEDRLVRTVGHPQFLSLRVGWQTAPTPGPLVVRLGGGGPLAIRSDHPAGVVRWLIAQAVARHAARDLCLVASVAPEPGGGAGPDENWLWLNWLPHARPSAAPLVGPHVATTPDAANDLVARLSTVVSARAAAPSSAGPRVLAVLDSRLGPLDLAGLAGMSRFGVAVVVLFPMGPATPYGMSTLDVAGERCRLIRAGQPPGDGETETVPTAYVRALADALPD